MANLTIAYTALTNASMLEAANEAYKASPIGIFFWPIIFLFTLFMVAIKTENPAFVFIYAVIGNFVLSQYLFSITDPIFWGIAVISLFMVLWSFFGTDKLG